MNLNSGLKIAIQRQNLLALRDRVLVAVSGGPDSVALLHILCDLRDELKLHLEVAHLNHGIRAVEGSQDVRFVRALAERLNLPFHLKEVSVPCLRSRAGGNLEALARRERYRFFVEVAGQQKLDKIATAHTQDDQAETMLMWLLRGTGRRGLGGIASARSIHLTGIESSKAVTLIRPLLAVGKDELLRFLDERGLEYRLDCSNQETVFLRNWIRLELLPRLRERAGAGVTRRLAQVAEILREEEVWLDALARKELDGLGTSRALKRDDLLRHPPAIQRRMLRLWIAEAAGTLRGLDFAHVEELRRLISGGPPHSRMSIPGDWRFIREYNSLRLASGAGITKAPCYLYPLVIGGVTVVPEADMKIECRLSSGPVELPNNHSEAVFDPAALTKQLVLRNFRRGDRFQPLGMTGHKKVKDLFIEKRVPFPARALLPLLVMGEEVLWLPGYGRSEIGRVAPGAKEGLRFRALGGLR